MSEVHRSNGKILVIRGGAIGDFILTLPVLAALREQFPETRLEVLGYPHIAQLALAGGLADEVRSIEARALAGFFARAGKLDAGLAEYFGGFALIVSYLYDPDGIFRANVAVCTRAQFIAGPHRPPESGPGHATEFLLQPLERLAISDPDPVPELSVPAPTGPGLAGGAWLAAHPGSGSEKKNWPERKWAELLQLLAATTCLNLLLVGGEAEADRLVTLGALWPAARLRLARHLPLSELAALLAHCDAFVGHDSGITHLAAAVGLPGVVLWGDTNAEVWRPMGERMRILRDRDGLAALPVRRVAEEVGKMFIVTQ